MALRKLFEGEGSVKKFWIVDAFASQPYQGNPAAVMVVEEFPNDLTCQKIASEVNLSETAFVKKLKNNYFHIRWFSPKIEAKLCGHATLASAHILCQEALVNGKEIHFETLSGLLKVSISSPYYTLDFPLQKTGAQLSLGYPENIVQAVKAHDDVLIELACEEDVKNYEPSWSELKKIGGRAVIITSKGEGHYDFVSRFFAPKVGINEDPVTGSAHCKLAHYWSQKLHKKKFLAYQASSRGGEIHISIHGDRVHLKGSAVTVLKGTWVV